MFVDGRLPVVLLLDVGKVEGVAILVDVNAGDIDGGELRWINRTRRVRADVRRRPRIFVWDRLEVPFERIERCGTRLGFGCAAGLVQCGRGLRRRIRVALRRAPDVAFRLQRICARGRD